jgi:hypothetical protein
MQQSCLAAPKFLSGRVRIPKQMVRRHAERRFRNKRYPDRIYRGRILAQARREGGVSLEVLGSAIDETFNADSDSTWLLAMVSRLRQDNMVDTRQGRLYLANS